MRRIASIIMVFIFLIILASCGKKFKSADSQKDEKQVIALINSYSVKETNGFDYSLEQSYGDTIVNAHYITLRLDHSNGLIGSRDESKRELNNDLSDGQFTNTRAISYYKDDRIATYENDSWNWKTCSFDEFALIKISSFNFDLSKLNNLKFTSSGNNKVLTIIVDDSYSSTFLGIQENVKNLVLTITVNSNLNELISFEMNYSQNLTSTKFVFIPYYNSVNIVFPDNIN